MTIDKKFINNISGNSPVSICDYKCGYCNRHISARVVNIYSRTQNQVDDPHIQFMICPFCIKGSIWLKGKIIHSTKTREKFMIYRPPRVAYVLFSSILS